MSENYCPHGTYVGDAWGPDYLCGMCEEGYVPPVRVEGRDYVTCTEKVVRVTGTQEEPVEVRMECGEVLDLDVGEHGAVAYLIFGDDTNKVPLWYWRRRKPLQCEGYGTRTGHSVKPRRTFTYVRTKLAWLFKQYVDEWKHKLGRSIR